MFAGAVSRRAARPTCRASCLSCEEPYRTTGSSIQFDANVTRANVSSRRCIRATSREYVVLTEAVILRVGPERA